MHTPAPGSFEDLAAGEGRGGFLRDLWFFLRENKKWWLAPVLLLLVLFSGLVLLSGTAVAPFLYTLF